jgi:hypothetical protein
MARTFAPAMMFGKFFSPFITALVPPLAASVFGRD